jgi:hypothetical protein
MAKQGDRDRANPRLCASDMTTDPSIAMLGLPAIELRGSASATSVAVTNAVPR